MSQSSIIDPHQTPSNLTSTAVNGNSHASSTTPTFSATVPTNKGSRSYTLPEAFQVWETSKNNILAPKTHITGVQADESSDSSSFKHSKPHPIYHLRLNETDHVTADMQTLSLGANETSQPSPAASAPAFEAIHQSTHQLPTQTPSLSSSSRPLAPTTSLISPDQILWLYLDSSGNEQGPFNGGLMHSWFTDGYLSLDLQIKRQNSEYHSLKSFCELVGDYVAPFKVPLPPLSQAPQANQPHPSEQVPQLSNGLNGSLLGSLSQPFAQPMAYQFSPIPSLLQHQIGPNPVLTRGNSNWGINDFSSPSTPITVNTGISSQPTSGSNGSQPGGPMPISPWTSTVNSQSRVNSPFAPVVESADPVLANLHSTVVTGILGDFDQPTTTPDPSESVPEFEPIVQPKVVIASEQVAVPEPVQEPIVQPRVVIPGPEPQAAKPEPPKETTPKPSPKVQVLKPVSAADVKAPWAASTKPEAAPKMTLKEIQQLESAKLKQQKKLEAQLKLENQTKALKEEILREEREKAVAGGLPTTSNWTTGGATNGSTKVIKTLAEIQEEERKAASLAKGKSKTPINSIAAQIASSSPEDSGAWSTVTSKKVAKKASTSTLIKSSTTTSSTNPSVLRSVSAPVVATSHNNFDTLRQDFVIWARSQMTNLYPSVSSNDLLEMFISLPNNTDSSQLISETIYSSSATMNGRVFAQEFLKKRQQTERMISTPSDLSAWSQAIIESADRVQFVDEEGWSTTNKKKKGRKN